MVMSIEERLSASQASYKEASVGYEPPQPGTYECKIVKAELVENQNNQRLQIKWTMTILNGTCQGKSFSNYTDVEGQYITSFKILIKILGFDPDTYHLAQIPQHIESGALTDKNVLFTIVENPKAANYPYINAKKRLDDVVAETPTMEQAPPQTTAI